MTPRSKATVNNAAMSGAVMQAPRPDRRNDDGTMVEDNREEPHGWTQKYVDSNGDLTVALDCGMCFTNVPQHQVLAGTADLACDRTHRNRDDSTYDAIRNVATITIKGENQ